MVQYNQVLIPTDFSPWADASVERCPEIAGIQKVLLLHITTPRDIRASPLRHNTSDQEFQEIRNWMEQRVSFLRSEGIQTEILIEQAHGPVIARTILDIANQQGADLIMIGARGAGRVREALLGSVAHDVIREARQHVLIMHPLAKANGSSGMVCPLLFSTVFCPVDFSRMSEEAIRSVRELDGRSRLILFHALPRAESATQLDLLRKRAMDRLSELKRELSGSRITADINIEMGDPVLLSCTLAERENTSLLLLSRYGRSDYMKNIPVGKIAEAIALRSTRPVLIRNDTIPLEVSVRELSPDDFPVAEQVWLDYHQQKADKMTDRIYAIFVENVVAGVARCKRHPDGVEVDGVFISPEFRDRGYARRLMQELVHNRGHESLYMHATLELVSFYHSFGFEPIPERDLPPTIRERFSFAQGNMEGSHVRPMRRNPDVIGESLR